MNRRGQGKAFSKTPHRAWRLAVAFWKMPGFAATTRRPVEIYSPERIAAFYAEADLDKNAAPKEKAPGPGMRIFLDANILFSAAKSDGAVRRLLALLRAARHELCADGYVIEEARHNLAAKTQRDLEHWRSYCAGCISRRCILACPRRRRIHRCPKKTAGARGRNLAAL